MDTRRAFTLCGGGAAKKTVAVLAVAIFALSGCVYNQQPALVGSVPSSASSGVVPSSAVAADSFAAGSGGAGDWLQYELDFDGLVVWLSLPDGLSAETGETPRGWSGNIRQNGTVVPVEVLDVGGYEMFYGKSICSLGFELEGFLEAQRNAGTSGFRYPEEGLITETFVYSDTLEAYTYCGWGDYIIYHYPTPGVGGPYPHLVFTHLPSGFFFNFVFSGESVSEALAYYSEIVATAQYEA